MTYFKLANSISYMQTESYDRKRRNKVAQNSSNRDKGCDLGGKGEKCRGGGVSNDNQERYSCN